MLLLASTSDLLRVVTSAAVATDVHASWADLNGTTVTPGRTNTAIATATTTTVVAAPASSTYRTVKTLTVRNRSASPQVVTVVHTDGSNAMELVKVSLAAGESLHYDEGEGFTTRDSEGRAKTRADGLASAAVNTMNTVVLASDVVNNNATLNTMADVTGLSFGVVAGESYYFEFVIPYTAAATTTGSRWSINGPGSPTLLAYRSEYTLTTTTTTINSAVAYDIPAASNATSGYTTGNVATIWGVIQPSGSGTVIARFASEVASSAITAKAGAFLRWIRTL